MWMPTRCAASRMVSPRSQATSWPSIVTSTWPGRGLACGMFSTVVAMLSSQLLAQAAATAAARSPERTLTASNLQTWRQVSHLMHSASSITCSCFFSPVMQAVGHFLAQSMQPVQSSGSM